MFIFWFFHHADVPIIDVPPPTPVITTWTKVALNQSIWIKILRAPTP